MFKLAIILCVGFVASKPNDPVWKLQMEIHKNKSEKTINDTVDMWKKYMNDRRVFNDKIVMAQKEALNASIQNTIDMITQLKQIAVGNHNDISNDVDISDCERHSEFSEAADAARIKAEKCIDGKVRTSLRRQTNIDYIVLKELERLELVRKNFRQCDDDADDEDSADEAMYCYERQKNQASIGVSESMNAIKAEIEKNKRSSESLEADVNWCRDNSGFPFSLNKMENIVNEFDICIQRKINEAKKMKFISRKF